MKATLVVLLWLILSLSRGGAQVAAPAAPAADSDEAEAKPAAGKHRSLSVLEFGAVADAKTDDTAAFQKAMRACGEQGGGIVEVPAGTYRIAGNLRIPGNVALRGTFQSGHTGNAIQVMRGRGGSSLLAYAGRGKPDAEPFITLNGENSVLDGFTIYYPEVEAGTLPPVPYPPTVGTDNKTQIPKGNVAILNCLFLNSYDAISLVRAGLHQIRNVTGYPSHCGIYIDQALGLGRIENVHFRPFDHVYTTEDTYSQWINRQAVAFEIGYADWEILSDCFCFGYGTAYKFVASPIDGKSGCGKLIGCGADSSGMPLQFQACYSHWEISNGEFVGRWNGTGTVAVDVGPEAKGRISFSNCAFWGPIGRVLSMRAPEAIVSLLGCQIQSWKDAEGAIDIEAGRAILQGNSFDRTGKRHLIVGSNAGQVIATGNLAAPHFDVEAAAGTHVILSANQ